MIVSCIPETLGTGRTHGKVCSQSSQLVGIKATVLGNFLTGQLWGKCSHRQLLSRKLLHLVGLPFKYAFSNHTTDFHLSFSFFPLLNERIRNQVDFQTRTNRKYISIFHIGKRYFLREHIRKSDNFLFVCGKRVRDIYNTTQKIFFYISIRQCLLL